MTIISVKLLCQLLSLYLVVALKNDDLLSSRELQNREGPSFPPYSNGQGCSRESMTVNFAYYQSWATYREDDCHPVAPGELDASAYTHIAYSFAGINEDLELDFYTDDEGVPVEAEELMYEKFMLLREKNPDVKLLISIGGWLFNDPGPTDRRFSHACKDENRPRFVKSIVDFCEEHGFDGVDLDWEFPGDYGRGGVSDDKRTYADLVFELKEAFQEAGHSDWEVSMAIPLHPRFLEQGYDMERLAQGVDLLIVMAYNLHGVWDPVALSHSDLYGIMDYLDHFIIDQQFPTEKMVLGLAPYGRTYTMVDESCVTVGCRFIRSGPGGCLNEPFFMTYFSIKRRIESGNFDSKIDFNPNTGASELVFDGNILVTYDSPEALSYKAQYAKESCFAGVMWWGADMLEEPIILPEIEKLLPSQQPSAMPSTDEPSSLPSSIPSQTASDPPSGFPTITPAPTHRPTLPIPTTSPSHLPSALPSMSSERPSSAPSAKPTKRPIPSPTFEPTGAPVERATSINQLTRSSAFKCGSTFAWVTLLLPFLF
mmetsp:Transcript_10848/g.15988  ORF Transcript_10848/g.15988 Transcript_10848/m.15988 type:complete len:540 (-) Transcript_10848:216-1835(-)|eukprot:CAMPEP_0194224962 /NCGR_PEP_ID=MMETSP0156-20130528/38532_1 /TAXON_ID=33649 /ORGANISM="Thalassionema nitzschioides, Strain L26-B" /LENGTH=539 /DNA_ID=CAMNT_0038956727 /DNA_START=37 /DNA_END=1656 /DNA_ORIENTATION=-